MSRGFSRLSERVKGARLCTRSLFRHLEAYLGHDVRWDLGSIPELGRHERGPGQIAADHRAKFRSLIRGEAGTFGNLSVGTDEESCRNDRLRPLEHCLGRLVVVSEKGRHILLAERHLHDLVLRLGIKIPIGELITNAVAHHRKGAAQRSRL